MQERGKIERTAIRVRLERMKLRGLKTSADEEMMRLDGKMRTNWANLRKPKQNRSEGEEKIRWRWNLCANSNSNLHASSPSPLVSRIQSNEVRNVTTAANDKSDLWKFDAEKEKTAPHEKFTTLFSILIEVKWNSSIAYMIKWTLDGNYAVGEKNSKTKASITHFWN